MLKECEITTANSEDLLFANLATMPEQQDCQDEDGSVELTATAEYLEGELAYRQGLTTKDNPYRFRSAQHWRWQEGLLGNGLPRSRSI
jgi:hypothetical protein